MADKQDSLEDGQSQAKADLAAGQPKYYYGARGSWARDMESTLMREFGIELVVTSCFVWEGLLQFRRGYNDVIQASIDSKQGAGAFQRALDGVQERRKAAYDKYFAEHPPEP